jgi:SAM-dependent methyltransferase
MFFTHRPAGEVLDPVDAYNRLAPAWAEVANERQPYLDAIVRLILDGIPPGSSSLLDVGAGDGARADRIAAGAALRKVVLLEPASAMHRQYKGSAEVWTARAEDLAICRGSFDVITCLWNVLGHIHSPAARCEVLRQCGRLLEPQGRIFIDINHRYNARHYGALATAARFLQDTASHDSRNGDVRVNWNVNGERIVTAGHVFTHREFATLAADAGLIIEKRLIVDYETGELRRRSFEGNLLYVLCGAGAFACPITPTNS